jgi:hypothetical protein
MGDKQKSFMVTLSPHYLLAKAITNKTQSETCAKDKAIFLDFTIYQLVKTIPHWQIVKCFIL